MTTETAYALAACALVGIGLYGLIVLPHPVRKLVAFNVINTRNRFVGMLGDFLDRITEPALRPIRRVMPNLGGIDISPIILILLIYFVRDLVNKYVFGAF